ncbi:MAG: hypothetical protein PF450_01185, partial [Bacteroidales bacterium]|nr:hypothetical protein [Bacteroidales bacterium]
SIPTDGITASRNAVFCAGYCIVPSNVYNSAYEYQWQLGGANLSGADSSKYIAKSSGDYTIQVSNPLGNCTSVSDTVKIQVNSLPSSPTISYSGSTSFCDGNSILLSVPYSASNSYQWKVDGSDIGSNSNTLNAQETGNYWLIVTNTSDCSSTSIDSVNVSVYENPAIPTVKFNTPTSF